MKLTIRRQIILNGQPITSDEIGFIVSEMNTSLCIPGWEKELYLFLNEWFSDSDFILAKSSGSTGEPKQIKLPKSLIRKSAERTIQYFGLQKNDRLLLSLPCRYIAGKMMVVRAIIGHMNLITVDPSGNFDLLFHEKFDFGAMVPNQVFMLLEQVSGMEKLQNIRNLLVGGTAISATLEARIRQLSNRVVSTYGMTETASHIAIRELSGKRKSEYYQCLPGISVGLNDSKCLQIKLPESDNFLQTNDLAELQSATSFKILGRADSVIISGGIKYSPEVLEKKLEGMINQRFLISSVPDERLGEKLVLVIEGNCFDTNLLEQKLSAILAPFEQPKLIIFQDKFQETTTGKLNREKVKKTL